MADAGQQIWRMVDLVNHSSRLPPVKIVATNEAKTHLSSLLQEVMDGKTIVISRGKKPLAKLVPYHEPAARPKVGEVMDEPFSVPDEAFRPATGDELRSWGL
jgi:prevent-host-death family protein